eukprot:3757796-Prymnesium_polylepis.1
MHGTQGACPGRGGGWGAGPGENGGTMGKTVGFCTIYSRNEPAVPCNVPEQSARRKTHTVTSHFYLVH